MSDAADELNHFAANFPVPQHGRYVQDPARFNEQGISYLPPAPPDRVPKVAAGVAIGAVLVAAGALLVKKA